MEFLNPPSLPPPVGPYSQAGRIGRLLFCAGQLALDRKTSQPLSELDVGEQTRVVLENLEEVLKGAGSTLDCVLKTTVYLSSLDDYGEMNRVYRDFFPHMKPARATVEVAGLIGGLRVEIEAVAVIPEQTPTDKER